MNPIKHVVVLMLENRSFDQMLGCMQAVFPNDVDGIDPTMPPRQATDAEGNLVEQLPKAWAQLSWSADVNFDPLHEYPNVSRQLDPPKGFVYDFSREYKNALDSLRSAEERRNAIQQIMAYFPFGTLPALHRLAQSYTICDHWFAAVPGPTWANRFFAHSGTSKGYVRMPDGLFHPHVHIYDQDTIYNRLTAAGKTWRIYHSGMPQSMVLTKLSLTTSACNFCAMNDFFKDAGGREEDFPAYSFIEPRYGDERTADDQGNEIVAAPADDDHPPHNVLNGQNLIARVYNALRQNQPLWETTLLVVVYDEHGGFYDHVPPPSAPVPDAYPGEQFNWQFKDRTTQNVTAKFDQYGVRVPALLISPWVQRRVCHETFDHTSVLQFVTELWNLEPLPSARMSQANSIQQTLSDTRLAETAMPQRIGESLSEHTLISSASSSSRSLNSNQKALIGYTKTLTDFVSLGASTDAGR